MSRTLVRDDIPCVLPVNFLSFLKHSRMENIGIGLFVLIIGSAAIIAAIYSRKLHKRIDSWVRTPGKITKKWVDLKSISNSSRTQTHQVYVEYSYRVNDKGYIGNNHYAMELNRGAITVSESKAKKEVEEMPDDAMVYYDPYNPEDSFINKGKSHFVLIFALGIVLTFIGLITLLVGIFGV